jgi:hypothetical protein
MTSLSGAVSSRAWPRPAPEARWPTEWPRGTGRVRRAYAGHGEEALVATCVPTIRAAPIADTPWLIFLVPGLRHKPGDRSPEGRPPSLASVATLVLGCAARGGRNQRRF